MPIDSLARTFQPSGSNADSFVEPRRKTRAQSMAALKSISFVPQADGDRGLQTSGFGDDVDDLPLDLAIDPSEVKSFAQEAYDLKNELQQKTFLSEAVIQHLDKEDSAMLLWLRSSTGFLLQCVLFAVFVGLDAGNSLFKSKAMYGTKVVSQSSVVLQSCVQIVLGLGTALMSDGIQGLKRPFEAKNVKSFGVLALFFGTAQMFNTMSYKRLSAGTIKIIGQVRLLQTAALSKWFLGRSYNTIQWTIMTMVCLSACVYCVGKSDAGALGIQTKTVANLETQRACILSDISEMIANSSKGIPLPALQPDGTFPIPDSCKIKSKPQKVTSDSDFITGVFFVFCYLLLSDLGSIVSEKFFKEDAGTPFYVQKVSIEITQLPMSFLLSFAVPYINQFCAREGDDPNEYLQEMWWREGNAFFQGWSTVVFIAMLISTGQSWLSGLVTKKMSSIMKLLGKLSAVVVVYVLNDILMATRQPPAVCSFACCLLVLGTYVFLSAKPTPPPKAPAVTPKRSIESNSSEKADVEMPRRQ